MFDDVKLAADDDICEALCEVDETQQVEYLLSLIECAIFQLKHKQGFKV